MVDFPALEQTVSGHLSSLHNWAKNIETAHLGNYYTTVIENLDYYVVECVAKPTLNKAPEWLSDNRAVSFVKDYKGLVIVATTIALTIFIVVMLHPKAPAKKPDIDPTKPKPKTPREGEESPRANGENNGSPKTDKSNPSTPRSDENGDEGSPRASGGKTGEGTTTSSKIEKLTDDKSVVSDRDTDEDSATAQTAEGKPKRTRTGSEPSPRHDAAKEGSGDLSLSSSIPLGSKTSVAISVDASTMT